MGYAFPTGEFERLVLQGKLRAGKNPILKWELSGCVPYTDTNENVRLDKGKATKRIDGIIASIMALAGTMSIEESDESKYNNPDVEFFGG
jgi:phage terminase large subunit-like protein